MRENKYVPLRDWAAPSYDASGRSCSTNGGSGAGTARECHTQIPSIEGRDKHEATLEQDTLHKTHHEHHSKVHRSSPHHGGK